MSWSVSEEEGQRQLPITVSGPYRARIDVNTLWMGDNYFHANAMDHAGNENLEQDAIMTIRRVAAPKPTPTPPPDTAKPGGTWISPGHNFVATGNKLHFEARAYDNPGGSGVAYVNFTVTYPGKGWFAACPKAALKKGTTDVYQCDWDVSKAKVPNGPITVSFDVYDKAGNYTLAPHGLRKGEVKRSTQPPTSGCKTSLQQWQNYPIAPQTGTFTMSFDATPNNAQEDVVTSLSAKPATTWNDMAVSVRFYTSGYIEAINGAKPDGTTIEHGINN